VTGFLATAVYAGQHSVGGLEGLGTQTFISTTGTGSTTSASFTATPLGGTAPYTYAWSYVAGPIGIAINSPTSASSTATATLGIGDIIRGFVACTITDNAGTIVETNQITIQFQYG
jgi:hypothetical protein